MTDWQLPVVILLVLAAAGYLSWVGWRAWRGGKVGCGGGTCACSGKKDSTNGRPIPLQDLTLRHRDANKR
jgi:hypothetical protein